MKLFNYTNGTKLSILDMMTYTALTEKDVDIGLISKVFFSNGEQCITIVMVVKMGCQEFGSHDAYTGSRSKQQTFQFLKRVNEIQVK